MKILEKCNYTYGVYLQDKLTGEQCTFRRLHSEKTAFAFFNYYPPKYIATNHYSSKLISHLKKVSYSQGNCLQLICAFLQWIKPKCNRTDILNYCDTSIFTRIV